MLDPKNTAHLDMIAEVIADREYGCKAGRYRRIMEMALAGGDFYAHTIMRLRDTARNVIIAINRAAPGAYREWVDEKEVPLVG